jgi:hypothetical protein
MIQRVQSIFLALVAILMGTFPIFQFYWRVEANDSNAMILLNAFAKMETPTGGKVILEYWPYSIVGIFSFLACGIAIYEIIQYKKRMLQLKIGLFNTLFMTGTLVSMVLFVNQSEQLFGDGAAAYNFTFWFPALALVCNLMANRFIRKDEKLVRSADRMR